MSHEYVYESALVLDRQIHSSDWEYQLRSLEIRRGNLDRDQTKEAIVELMRSLLLRRKLESEKRELFAGHFRDVLRSRGLSWERGQC